LPGGSIRPGLRHRPGHWQTADPTREEQAADRSPLRRCLRREQVRHSSAGSITGHGAGSNYAGGTTVARRTSHPPVGSGRRWRSSPGTAYTPALSRGAYGAWTGAARPHRHRYLHVRHLPVRRRGRVHAQAAEPEARMKLGYANLPRLLSLRGGGDVLVGDDPNAATDLRSAPPTRNDPDDRRSTSHVTRPRPEPAPARKDLESKPIGCRSWWLSTRRHEAHAHGSPLCLRHWRWRCSRVSCGGSGK
jgi:hypothetical protein